MNETKSTLFQDLSSWRDLYCHLPRNQHVILFWTFLALGLLNGAHKIRNTQGTSLLAALAVFFAVLCITPCVFFILILFKCYRLICHFYLKMAVGKSYIGLLEGPDSFWTTDESISKSIINILALVDFKGKDSPTSIQIMQSTIKRRLLENLEDKYKKILYQRKTQQLGFTYWKQQSNINIKDHVRLFPTNNPTETLTETEMKSVISDLCNLTLPSDNATNWEVILIDKKVSMMEGQLSPVLIRIHHSVGDGFALVDLFLNVLTDSKNNKGDDIEKNDTTERIVPPLHTRENYNIKADEHEHYKSIKRGVEKMESKTSDVKQYLRSDKRPEETSQSMFYKPNMGRLNWHFLKMKIRTLNRKDFWINSQPMYTENSSKVTSILDHQQKKKENIIDGNRCLRQIKEAVDFNRDIPLKDGVKHACDVQISLNDKKKAMALGIEDSSKRNRHGTLYMKDIYYTPLSPVNSSIILECFSCSNQMKCSRFLSYWRNVLKSVGQIPYYLDQFFKIYLMRPTQIIKKYLTDFLKIIFLPINMLNKRLDQNILHTSKQLTKNKSISFVFDDDLLEMIKHIKTSKDIKFNEIVLRAVSDSFEIYFQDKTKGINIIIPVPISKERAHLKNDFTVCMFDLPIRFLDKINIIHNKYEDLQNNIELAVNYYLLKYTIDSIPYFLLKHVLKSRQSTLVLSNMIGPNHEISFSGHLLKRLIFFVPNKDTTGVGITLLGYNRQLALGIIMDDSLGETSKQDVHKILENMKNSIYRMYAECFV